MVLWHCLGLNLIFYNKKTHSKTNFFLLAVIVVGMVVVKVVAVVVIVVGVVVVKVVAVVVIVVGVVVVKVVAVVVIVVGVVVAVGDT